MNNHRYFNVTLTGRDSMLHCGMDLEREDAVRTWYSDPVNKSVNVKADDRSPAWTWISRLYHNSKVAIMPTDNIQSCISEAASAYRIPNGNGARFKNLVNSSLVHIHPHWNFTVSGKEVPVTEFLALEEAEVNDFSEYTKLAGKHGFKLMVKAVKIKSGSSKKRHIRVRPWFFNWQIHGQVITTDELLDREMLQQIFTYAGVMKGIGDWRPAMGGPYGAFTAEVEEFSGF